MISPEIALVAWELSVAFALGIELRKRRLEAQARAQWWNRFKLAGDSWNGYAGLNLRILKAREAKPLCQEHIAMLEGELASLIAREKAFHRSIALLMSWLSKEQLKQFRTAGDFDVVGGVTGRRYRLEMPDPYNIKELGDDGCLTSGKLCLVPEGPLGKPWPAGDILLMQKLSLELDECEALRIANRSPMLPDPNLWHATESAVQIVVGAADGY